MRPEVITQTGITCKKLKIQKVKLKKLQTFKKLKKF